MSDRSPNRIDRARYDCVTRRGVCPGCGDHVISRVPRPRLVGEDERTGRQLRGFGGAYWRCMGPSGHLCWHMSVDDGSGRPLYETFGEAARYSRPAAPVETPRMRPFVRQRAAS